MPKMRTEIPSARLKSVFNPLRKLPQRFFVSVCLLFGIGMVLPGCVTRKVYEIGLYKTVMEPKVVSLQRDNENALVFCEDANQHESSVWVYKVNKRMFEISLYENGNGSFAQLAQDGYEYWKQRKRVDRGEIKSLPAIDGSQFLDATYGRIKVREYIDRHRWYYYPAVPLYIPAAVIDIVTFPFQYLYATGTGIRVGP